MKESNREQLEALMKQIQDIAYDIEDIYNEEYGDRDDLEELEHSILADLIVPPHENLEFAKESLDNAVSDIQAYINGWHLLIDKKAREQFIQEFLTVPESKTTQTDD